MKTTVKIIILVAIIILIPLSISRSGYHSKELIFKEEEGALTGNNTLLPVDFSSTNKALYESFNVQLINKTFDVCIENNNTLTANKINLTTHPSYKYIGGVSLVNTFTQQSFVYTLIGERKCGVMTQDQLLNENFSLQLGTIIKEKNILLTPEIDTTRSKLTIETTANYHRKVFILWVVIVVQLSASFIGLIDWIKRKN